MQNLSQYTWAMVLGTIILAFILPKPGMMIQPLTGYLLITLMTLTCLQIKLTDIKKAFTHKTIYLTSLTVLLITPLIAWAFKSLLSPAAFAGLIIATAAPAGVSVAFITELFKGKPADALSITTLTHILSVATIPFLLKIMVGGTLNIEAATIALTLAKYIILPLLLAQVLRKALQKFEKILSLISIIILLLIIWAIIAPTTVYIMSNIQTLLVVSAVSAICMSAAFGIGWLTGKNKKEKITYSISGSYKNYTLTTVIALSAFGEVGALASIAYTILNNILFAAANFFVKRT